jgi:hypothetical protein
VALDDPMQFHGVAALEQPGERLQDAVRSIVKTFEAVVTLEPDLQRIDAAPFCAMRRASAAVPGGP